jgi:hypothetical protein
MYLRRHSSEAVDSMRVRNYLQGLNLFILVGGEGGYLKTGDREQGMGNRRTLRL